MSTVEQFPDPVEELVEQLGDGQAGQTRVGDGFEPPQPLVVFYPLSLDHARSLALWKVRRAHPPVATGR